MTTIWCSTAPRCIATRACDETSPDWVNSSFTFPHSPMIGEGDWKFEFDSTWAKLPDGYRLGYTHGIVQDRSGRFYIANQSRDAIIVLDPEGNFLNSWGRAYEKGAHGLTIALEGSEEVLYLANTDLGEVVKTSLSGEEIWKRGAPTVPSMYGERRTYSPTETAVAPDGRLYVADGYGESWIHVYDRDGTYLDSFGGKGEGPEYLDGAHGVSIDMRSGTPRVQVSDRNHYRIVEFDLEGNYLGEVIGAGAVRFPCTTVHSGDYLYVPDLFARLSVFDRDNRKVADLGDYFDGDGPATWGEIVSRLPGYPNIATSLRKPDRFIAPHSLWVDGGGDIYVVEWLMEGRITRLRRTS